MKRYATDEEARTYYAGQDAHALDLSIIMGAAARTVAALASPEPEEVVPRDPAEPDVVLDPDVLDYREAMKGAELIIGKYIHRTDGGTLSSKSLSGVTSKSYAKLSDVQTLAAQTLGKHFAGGSPGSSGTGKSVGYVGTWPF